MPIYSFFDKSPKLPEADRYWIAPGAHIIGNVEIGDDVGIWFNSVARGDNDLIKIGARSNIQEGCTIGHHAIIHGCQMGDNCMIGMGATILNGAKLGKNCLVGANSLVTEGKEFPDNSMIIGSPAKVVKTLDEEAAEWFRKAAEHYTKRWQELRDGMQLIEP